MFEVRSYRIVVQPGSGTSKNPGDDPGLGSPPDDCWAISVREEDKKSGDWRRIDWGGRRIEGL